MTSSPWLILLGMVVGTFGTLIGAGGGFILMPVLLLLDPQMKPATVTAISLAVVFANAASGTIAYARMKRIDYRTGAIFAFASIPGATLGAWAVRALSGRTFDAVFGTVLLAVSAVLLLRRSPLERVPSRGAGVNFPGPSTRRLGILISGAVGFLSSFLGIGGGIIHVPAMVHLLAFPVHLATATSHFVLMITAAVATGIHIAQGTLSGVAGPTLLLSAGVIPGGQLGAWLSGRVPHRAILLGLAAALGLVGIRILLLTLRP